MENSGDFGDPPVCVVGADSQGPDKDPKKDTKIASKGELGAAIGGRQQLVSASYSWP